MKDEQKAVREAVHDSAKQTKLWTDLEKLFIVKKEGQIITTQIYLF